MQRRACTQAYTHIQVGLLWTSDQPITDAATYTTQQTQETNIHALSGIPPRDCSNHAVADLRLRPHATGIDNCYYLYYQRRAGIAVMDWTADILSLAWTGSFYLGLRRSTQTGWGSQKHFQSKIIKGPVPEVKLTKRGDEELLSSYRQNF
jgi:hypothetical protein